MRLFLYGSEKNRVFRLIVLKSLRKLKYVIQQESIETKDMLKIYIEYSRGNATKEELNFAHEQFRDLLRTTGIGVILVLPFAPITLPFVLKLADKLDIELLPSSLKEEIEDIKE